MPVGGAHALNQNIKTKTQGRYPLKSVVSRMSVSSQAWTHTKDTHPSPRIDIKIFYLTGNRTRAPGWKAGTLPITPRWRTHVSFIMGGSPGDVSEEPDVGEAKEGFQNEGFHLRHSSFSNPSAALPTSQLILQPFRCFTYVTAHSQTLLSLLLRHRIFTYITWQAAHAIFQAEHWFNLKEWIQRLRR